MKVSRVPQPARLAFRVTEELELELEKYCARNGKRGIPLRFSDVMREALVAHLLKDKETFNGRL